MEKTPTTPEPSLELLKELDAEEFQYIGELRPPDWRAEGVGSDGICLSCGREYDDITDCPCPSDDCPSNEVA